MISNNDSPKLSADEVINYQAEVIVYQAEVIVYQAEVIVYQAEVIVSKHQGYCCTWIDLVYVVASHLFIMIWYQSQY